MVALHSSRPPRSVRSTFSRSNSVSVPSELHSTSVSFDVPNLLLCHHDTLSFSPSFPFLPLLLRKISPINNHAGARHKAGPLTSKEYRHPRDILDPSSAANRVHFGHHVIHRFDAHAAVHIFDEGRVGEAGSDCIDVDAVAGVLEGRPGSMLLGWSEVRRQAGIGKKGQFYRLIPEKQWHGDAGRYRAPR